MPRRRAVPPTRRRGPQRWQRTSSQQRPRRRRRHRRSRAVVSRSAGQIRLATRCWTRGWHQGLWTLVETPRWDPAPLAVPDRRGASLARLPGRPPPFRRSQRRSRKTLRAARRQLPRRPEATTTRNRRARDEALGGPGRNLGSVASSCRPEGRSCGTVTTESRARAVGPGRKQRRRRRRWVENRPQTTKRQKRPKKISEAKIKLKS